MEGSRSRQGGSERELALLIESVSDYAIFLLDPDGVIKTWNRGAERIKGYSADEIIGKHFSTFYTPDDRDRDHPANELKVARRDGRFEEEGWRLRKDGSRFWANVVITALRDTSGELVGFGKVTRDLTARRISEDRLRDNTSELLAANAQLDQFRRLVSSVRDYAIFMLDPSGRVATWNAGARHLKGYEAEEIVGRHFSIFYTDEDRGRDHTTHELALATAEGRYEEEGWRVRKDGTTFWASVTITAVRNDDGELIGFAKVTRDLTARREAEEALRAANERLATVNQELDRFASLAAHDLADPLQTIAGFAQLLEREQVSDTGREYIGHIGATAARMQRLLASLLEYARAGEVAGPPEPVSVRAATGNALEGLAAAIDERRAEVRVDVPDDAVVRAAPPDLERVLQNLVANALKFGDAERPCVLIEARPADGSVRITVADNGVGIAPKDRDRIFAAFERAHPELSRDGTGLGLAICERLVRRHGGSIGVDSEAGQGSRFWVLLPSVATA